MATLILSAAGSAIGGPAGSAIGTFLGRKVDRAFAQTAQARLTDWRAPSSQYGETVPAVLRNMRVAGVVLWASAPVVTMTVSKNDAGQGISVSFAYGLSTGRVEGVGRIWADGRLIRDQEGRQDVAFELRLHKGDEDQLSDPLIASILSERSAPAYRGIAYLLFENFDLSSFGNRLPILTVELVGASQALQVEGLLQDICEITGQIDASARKLEGFALAGDDKSEAIAPLCNAFNPAFAYDGTDWSLQVSPECHLVEAHFWQLESDIHSAFRMQDITGGPTKISLRFFDPDLDYAGGEKSCRLPGVERLRRIELPAALNGNVAKAAAAALLAESVDEERECWIRLPLRYSRINVGDEIAQDAPDYERFTVCEKRFQNGELTFRLKRPPMAEVSLPADAGGSATARTLHRTPLSVALIELPGEPFESEPEIGVLVCGGHSPFQALPLTIASPGRELQISSASGAASIGETLEALGPSRSEVTDRRNRLVVRFAQDPILTSCDKDVLLSGGNLLCIGGEFVQFMTAKLIGLATYELSGLLRGRFDSETDVAHPSGSAVYILDPRLIAKIKLPRDRIGATVSARAYGPDGAEAEAALFVAGRASRPWRPSHVDAFESKGDLAITWIRRCKEGGPWLDEVDAPLSASHETYTVVLRDEAGGRLQTEASEPRVIFGADDLSQLGPRPWRVEIRQLGDFAASAPHIHIIN